MAASKALEVWQELNERQQGTLAVIYELDQETEAARGKSAAAGVYDRAPASEWRSIDFASVPAGIRTTEMQFRLDLRWIAERLARFLGRPWSLRLGISGPL